MKLLLKCSKSPALLFFSQLDTLVKMAMASSATTEGIIWPYCVHYKTHQELYNIGSMYKQTTPCAWIGYRGGYLNFHLLIRRGDLRLSNSMSLTPLDWWWPASSSVGEVAGLWVELCSPTALSAFPLSLLLSAFPLVLAVRNQHR